MPPLGKMQHGGDEKKDPVPTIFRHIAAIAVATVPPKATSRASESPPQTPSVSDEESDQSSQWESDASEEDDNEEKLELDLDMGDATFATS